LQILAVLTDVDRQTILDRSARSGTGDLPIGAIPMKARLSVVLAVVVTTLICGTSLASTINVPAQQPTIQDGINAAVNGDTVLVAPGTYTENINFNGKAITVKSSKGAMATIIDGGNAARMRTRP
jgi:hypothetical protein